MTPDNEYTDYVIIIWNNDSDNMGHTENIHTLPEAEEIFTGLFDQYDNIELAQLHTTKTVLKHKYKMELL